MEKVYQNARIFTGSTVLENYTLVTNGKYISKLIPDSEYPDSEYQGSVYQSSDTKHQKKEGVEIYDLQRNMLVPAFIDLQIYGAAGHLLNNERTQEVLDETHRINLIGGTTRFLITLPTHSPAATNEAIELVNVALQKGKPGLLGLHLEGPFINPAKKGAHLEEYILKPNLSKLKELFDQGKDAIKMMTIAPELFDAEMLQFLIGTGWLISAGHSDATYNQGIKGFEEGIKTCTHLYNAMSPLQSRSPGLTGAAFNHSKVMASIIADGIHADFASVQIAKKTMGERLFLITDAVTESLDGPYAFYKSKNCFVNKEGILAGSALSMIQAVKNCVNFAGIPLEEALKMASTYPAKLAGLKDLGTLKPGSIADMLVLDKNMDINQVLYEGEAEQ